VILSAPFATLRRNRRVFVQTTIAEVRSRYAGSLLGLFWVILAPLALMSIYAAIYLYVFRVRPANMPASHYVVYVLSGLLPFLTFSDGLASGTSSLSSNRAILLSTVFPAELVPMRAVIASQAPAVIGLSLCIAAAAATGLASPAMIAIPVIWLLLLLFVLGIVWVLALANLLVKDIQHALGFVNMILLVASPIGYTLDLAPPALRVWLQLNPLAHYIDAIHDCVVYGRFPDGRAWAVLIAISLTSFFAGYWVFQRAKRVMLDYA
jgi:lipopolysaccharide transport system permease protein